MYELQQDTAILRDALQHYLKSLAYFSQTNSKNKTGPIGCYTLLSEAYGLLGKSDSSLYFLQQARKTDPEHIETQRFWGMHYNRIGDFESARQHFLKSNDMIAQKQGERHFLIGRNLVQVGRQYEAEELWHQALNSYLQAFSYLTNQKDEITDIFQNPDPRNAVSDRDFFECLRLKAGAMLSWSRVKSISIQERQLRLKNSIDTYQSAVKMLDQQRTKYVSSGYRQLIEAKALSVYEKAISACFDAVELGLDSAKYTKLAFNFMEKNKNRQLRDALRMKRNTTFAGLPQDLQEKELDLKRNLRYHSRLLIQEKQKPDAKQDSEKLQSLQDKVFTLSRQWEQFDQKLSKDHPAYHQLKNGEPVMKLSNLQSKLDRQTLLIEYFYGDEETFVFGITDRGVVFEKLLSVKALDQLLTKCLKRARKPAKGQIPTDSAMRDLNALYEGLFPTQLTIPSETNKLVIVPDGPLGYLPFEMLVTSQTEQTRYLLEDFDIRYVYSTYLLGQHSKHKKPGLAYLGFAPSYDQSFFQSSEAGLGNFGVLTHNEREVREANEYFSGRAFLGEASTEENFKDHGKLAGILHFSMHAVLDDERPELSRLIFHHAGNQGDDSEIDGNLYLYELYNESLQAQLTVLSSCNTGDGQLRRGEGINSLGRAFRFAGCNSIVMSLWEANDKHTSYLTSRFFFHLKEGKSKDAALRQAKLDFLNEPANKYFKHPFNWASLVLIGEPSKLNVSTDNFLLFSMLLAGIVLIVLIFYIRKGIKVKIG
ncbi:MAG: CHAT domain-containing protein [Bacteroidota bacterium]